MPDGEEPKPSTSGLGHMKMAMPMFSHMEMFVVGENFDEYENRLQQFFIVNDVEESKKVPMLVTMAGPSLCNMFDDCHGRHVVCFEIVPVCSIFGTVAM